MNKIKSIGIVAEYNPFHNGHSYHLTETKKIIGDLPVVAVMSGNFVQRGLPALADKWSRASIAVKNGIDLVLELPTVFACRSAEYFARGAIALLAGTGCVTHLSFGCETSDIDLLKEAAKIACDDAFYCKDGLTQGLSYAAAAGTALTKNNPELSKVVVQPNNILAIEYLKQISMLKTELIPVPINRISAMYNDQEITGNIASATAIRREFLKNGLNQIITRVVPEPTCTDLVNLASENRLGYDQKNLDLLLLYLLRQMTPQEIARRCECSEGLENKITKAAAASCWAEAVSMIKSKRYPETRINRLLLQIILSTPEITFNNAIADKPSYLRILAFNERGRKLLKTMKNTSTLPIINKLGKNAFYGLEKNTDFSSSLKIDLSASNIFNLLQGNPMPHPIDFKTSPFYLSE